MVLIGGIDVHAEDYDLLCLGVNNNFSSTFLLTNSSMCLYYRYDQVAGRDLGIGVTCLIRRK